MMVQSASQSMACQYSTLASKADAKQVELATRKWRVSWMNAMVTPGGQMTITITPLQFV